jgi:serine/threonine protein kinase
MDVSSIAGHIFSLAQAIHEQAQKVKANREQCVLLAERVQTIQSAIKKLGKISDSEAYRTSLGRLKLCLQEAYEYIKGLSSETWFQQFMRARDHQATFEQFHKRLAEAIPQLNLGLSAQAISNREEDQKAERADREMLLKKQDEILKLNEQLLNEVKHLPNQSFHERQMAALTSQLQALMTEVKTTKKSTALRLDEKITIPYFELRLEKVIGEGSMGTVYLGRWQEEPVAIKVWNGTLSSEKKEIEQFIRETQILQHLNVPRYVPRFFGASLEGGQACLVMEYCELGSLYDYLPKHPLMPVVQHHLALSLAQSLQFLHQKKIIHRDLKSANILLTTSGELLTAKITDFGLSKASYPSIASIKDVSREVAWCAPEILKGETSTYASDMFSMGMLLWEIFTGRQPFTGQSSLKEWISSGKQESLEGIPKTYAGLITRCWAINPRLRPSAAELVTALQLLPLSTITPVKEEKCITTSTSSPMTPSTQSTPKTRLESETLVHPKHGGVSSGPLPVMTFSSGMISAALPGEKKLSAGEESYEEAKRYHEQKDYVNARQQYETAWEAGIVKAGNKLATLLIRGQGGAKDASRAVALFTQLAESGDALSMSNLAQAYQHGVGVPKDAEKAKFWKEKHDQAAKQTSPGVPISTSAWAKGSPATFAAVGSSPSQKKSTTVDRTLTHG